MLDMSWALIWSVMNGKCEVEVSRLLVHTDQCTSTIASVDYAKNVMVRSLMISLGDLLSYHQVTVCNKATNVDRSTVMLAMSWCCLVGQTNANFSKVKTHSAAMKPRKVQHSMKPAIDCYCAYHCAILEVVNDLIRLMLAYVFDRNICAFLFHDRFSCWYIDCVVWCLNFNLMPRFS